MTWAQKLSSGILTSFERCPRGTNVCVFEFGFSTVYPPSGHVNTVCCLCAFVCASLIFTTRPITSLQMAYSRLYRHEVRAFRRSRIGDSGGIFGLRSKTMCLLLFTGSFLNEPCFEMPNDRRKALNNGLLYMSTF